MENDRPDAHRVEPAVPSRQRWIPFAIGTLAFFAALVLGLRTLYHAHPNEDAYILFKYADQLAAGHGIVYYPGGKHAEGATDFLWMVALACMRRIGCDVALGAVIGNALGAGGLAYLCARERLDRGAWMFGVLALAFVITGPAFAAYLGFSALLYSALAAWTFRRTLAAMWSERSSVAIPWLALVLALFRPDGLILGAGFACIGFFAARKQGEFRRYVRAACGAFVVALTYAMWRRWYFGLALPLPLYVKSPVAAVGGDLASKMPGLEANYSWSTAWQGPLPLLAGIVVLVFLAWPRKQAVVAFAVCLVPVLLHLSALSFARQTQNFLDRFQGPELAILFVSVFAWTARAHAVGASASRRILACCVGALAIVPTICIGVKRLPRVWGWNGGYIDSFAYALGRILKPTDLLALTEAGRLSFWTDARVEDVVGLNSPDTAVHPPTVDTLRVLDPDVLLFYAGQFRLRLHIADQKPLAPISPAVLPASVAPEFGAAFHGDDPAALDRLTPENRATIVMGKFAYESGSYDLFAGMNVLEKADTRNYSHVFGIRKTMPQHDELVEALRATANGEVSITYAQAAGLPFAAQR